MIVKIILILTFIEDLYMIRLINNVKRSPINIPTMVDNKDVIKTGSINKIISTDSLKMVIKDRVNSAVGVTAELYESTSEKFFALLIITKLYKIKAEIINAKEPMKSSCKLAENELSMK